MGITNWPQQLYFYMTPAHPCSYLPLELATTLLADPSYPMDRANFALLTEMGFRRSGEHLYTPRCPRCQACQPIRVIVARFQPNRSQRRNWQQNRDLTATWIAPAPQPTAEQFALYQRYIAHRHPDGSMATEEAKRFNEFFLSRWCDTQLVEVRLGEQLVAVAVVDRLPNALSAVYTFFEPNLPQRGLGSWMVLWLIHYCQAQQWEWLYLGFLIEERPNMAYKKRFRPYQLLSEEGWQEPRR